jgi:hypothetical protein
MEIIEIIRNLGKYIIFCVAAYLSFYAGRYKSDTTTSKILGYLLGVGFIIVIAIAFYADIFL